MSHQPLKIIVSGGEPAGIGPDIIVKCAGHAFDCAVTYIADPALLEQRAGALGVHIKINVVNDALQWGISPPGYLNVLPVTTRTAVLPGQLNTVNSQYTLDCIDRAVDLCKRHIGDAMATAPVHKGVINEAGIVFSGHTEWIARQVGVEHPVMMLANESMRVCLATTHLPLKDVANHINQEGLTAVLTIMFSELQNKFAIEQPVIGVCGLNPHAGEQGYLGTEEIKIISPVIQSFVNQGKMILGPLPADSAFTRHQLQQLDAILVMYHDQGLPVIKHSGFGEIVNITLGLPIIRTSVDHGTALDIAGTGKASETSLVAAIKMATNMARY